MNIDFKYLNTLLTYFLSKKSSYIAITSDKQMEHIKAIIDGDYPKPLGFELTFNEEFTQVKLEHKWKIK